MRARLSLRLVERRRAHRPILPACSARRWAGLHCAPPVWALEVLRDDRHRHWRARLERRRNGGARAERRDVKRESQAGGAVVPPGTDELVLGQPRAADLFGDVFAVDENPYL